MRAGLGGLFHLDAEAMLAADFVVDGIEAVARLRAGGRGGRRRNRAVGWVSSVSEEEIGEIIMPRFYGNPRKHGSTGALLWLIPPKKMSVLSFLRKWGWNTPKKAKAAWEVASPPARKGEA
jgi:hypothetical protein